MLNWPWLTARRLQTQLLVWTALILSASVIGAFEVQNRLNVKMLESNARVRAETMVQVIEEALEMQLAHPAEPLPLEDIRKNLDEFVRADATLTRLDLLQRRGNQLVVVASSMENADLLVSKFINTPIDEIRMEGSDRIMISSQAVKGSEYGVVAVFTLENIDRFLLFNRNQVPALAAVLLFVDTVLMYVMFKRTVSRRFDELLAGIRRAKGGEAAHIPDTRLDEIGVIARTLNGLISQVQSFNDELRSQVAVATESLHQRNLALEESARQMVEMQQQLLESERLATFGQMAATFAHEIGSPMSSLSAHVQLLLEDSRLSSDQCETLILVRQQIRSVVQIVNEMLRSARRGPSDFVLTDINDILRTVLRLVDAQLMARRIQTQIELGNIPLVRGYPLYLQEAFLNILNNASDAMPEGGPLLVNSWYDLDSQLVHVRITDSGPGIDAAIVEKMFGRFVTTKAMGEGAGLGLGIVKEIVESHRGTFEIAAEPGQGTTAHFTFPVGTSSTVLVS